MPRIVTGCHLWPCFARPLENLGCTVDAWLVSDDSPLSVAADHREPRAVLQALEQLDMRVTRTTLSAGDYIVGRYTRIERKTVRDLHSSVMSGRLWQQINHLRASCTYPIVLVEGIDIDAGPLRASSIRGVLVALADRGVPVLRAKDHRDSAAWIRSIALARVPGRRIQVGRRYRRPTGVRDPVAVSMLCTIPGISLQNARDLIAAFRTVAAIAQATPDQLRAVRGIGEHKSHAVHSAVTRVF